MMRVALEEQTQLELPVGDGKIVFTLDRVIGSGANSIVYAAYYMDRLGQCHSVHIKECYPHDARITRVGSLLCWQDAGEQERAKVRFRDSYRKLMEIQNQPGLRNATVHVFDICEANGTLYSIMDVNEGKTFDKDTDLTLLSILKTIRALSRVAEKYHKNGYLHLDIKPENFLTIPETRELVILFDLDSVTSAEDLRSGAVEIVPYSKGWAAPEQMQANLHKLCPATDIYAIGSVLFEKIMGRPVRSEDNSILAEWDMDLPVFSDVNPKVKRLLRKIFRKTLAANVRNRYQSAGELTDALSEVIHTIEKGAPYLAGNSPVSNIHFVGRQDELHQIDQLFEQGARCVFLQGFGGIGKTELSRKYAETYADRYDCIAFLRYDEKTVSLQSLLMENLQIVNFEDDQSLSESQKKDKQWEKLQELLTPETLLILDNYDVESPGQEFLKLLDRPCRWLVTTRSDFSCLGGQSKHITVGQLAFPELLEIFRRESRLEISREQEADLEALFDSFDHYTLVITLLAKQVHASGITLFELCNSESVYDYEERLTSVKDAMITQDTLLGHLQRVFNMAALTGLQQETLRTVWMLRDAEKLTKPYFKKYSGMSLNEVNTLISLGWLQYTGEEISLHPVIEQLVERFLQPSCQNCPHLYQTFERQLSNLRSMIERDEDCPGETENLFRNYAFLEDTDDEREEHLLSFALCLLQMHKKLKFREFDWFTGWENQKYFSDRIIPLLFSQKSSIEALNIIISDSDIFENELTLYGAELVCLFCWIQILCEESAEDNAAYEKAKFMYMITLGKMMVYAFQFPTEHIIRMLEKLVVCAIDSPESDIYGKAFIDSSISESEIYCKWVDDGIIPLTVHYGRLDKFLCDIFYNILMLIACDLIDDPESVAEANEYWLVAVKIRSELIRCAVGYDHFYDFLNPPEEYKTMVLDNCFIWDESKHFRFSEDQYFDQRNTQGYFDEVVSTLMTAKQPAYLFKLLLNRDFPISPQLKQMLIEWDMAKHIVENRRMNSREKRKIAEFAVKNLSDSADDSQLQIHCIEGILGSEMLSARAKNRIYRTIAESYILFATESFGSAWGGKNTAISQLVSLCYPLHNHTSHSDAVVADGIYALLTGKTIEVSEEEFTNGFCNFISELSIYELCRTEAFYAYLRYVRVLGGETASLYALNSVAPKVYEILQHPYNLDPGFISDIAFQLRAIESQYCPGEESHLFDCPICGTPLWTGTEICPYCNPEEYASGDF